MPDDLPSRLRAMAGPIKPNVCTEAADEIERLRAGGCARDQRLTQYCAEAAAMQAELAACRIAYEQAIRDRDAARLAYCRDVWQGAGDEDEQRQLTPREIAGRQGWPWPIRGSEIGTGNSSEMPNSSEAAS